MKKLFAILALMTLIYSCQNRNKNKTPLKEKKSVVLDSPQAITTTTTTTNAASPRPTGELTALTLSWSDSLVKMYMTFADNNLIKQARKDNFPEEWVYDNTLKTDSAIYDTYRIGHDVNKEDYSDTRFVIDQWVYVDTMNRQLYEYDVLTNKLKKWWTAEDVKHFFYPVYELSSKTTAMVINFNESNIGLLDTLFEKYCPNKTEYYSNHIPRGWKFFDTTGFYRLLKNDRLEKEVRKYFDREFYVYGTKGFVKTRFKDIVVGTDECITSIFAFCFDNSSIRSVGHPVFCSTKLIDLTFASDYSNIERGLDYFLSNGTGEYPDSTKLKVLGNAGNYFFTYHDDFLWGKNPQVLNCHFPSRTVLWIEKRNIARCWANVLGLICD